jgi:hypothetical protein
MKKVYTITILSSVSIAVCYFAVLAYVSWGKGFSWENMDWNQNGKTSLTEFFRASDVGVREIQKEGKTCKEFYAYKDGLPIKIVCFESPTSPSPADPPSKNL